MTLSRLKQIDNAPLIHFAPKRSEAVVRCRLDDFVWKPAFFSITASTVPKSFVISHISLTRRGHAESAFCEFQPLEVCGGE